MAKEAPQEKPAAAAPEAAKAAPSAMAGWLPVIAVVVLVPVLSFAMAEFVLFPRLEQRLGAAPAAGASGHGAKPAPAAAEAAEKAEPTFAYEFKDIVSNLAGSMRSRYIKVSFTAYSANPEFAHIVESNKAKLLDTTLSVLAALSLADLEQAGVKNRVRSELVAAYEGVLHERIIEEIYFSEFVIQ